MDGVFVDTQLSPSHEAKGPLPLLRSIERFIDEIDRDKQRMQQARRLVTAALAETCADATFWYSEKDHRILDFKSKQTHCETRCCDFFAQSLCESPILNGQLLRTELPGVGESSDPNFIPTSLAMTQLGPKGASWLCAMTFGEPKLGSVDQRVMSVLAKILVKHRTHLQAVEQFQQTLYGLLLSLTAAIDAKEPHTAGHSERVARIAFRLGQQMKLNEFQLSDLRLAGLLHDLGKLAVSDNILAKDGRLSADEMDRIRTHPTAGSEILENVKQLSHLCPIIKHHHERFDGSGYPDRLKGQQIPLAARIISVAESCDSMMHDRSYRQAMTTEEILAEFRQKQGSQWDPMVVNHFFDCANDVFKVYERGLGQSFLVAIQNTGKDSGKSAGKTEI